MQTVAANCKVNDDCGNSTEVTNAERKAEIDRQIAEINEHYAKMPFWKYWRGIWDLRSVHESRLSYACFIVWTRLKLWRYRLRDRL